METGDRDVWEVHLRDGVVVGCTEPLAAREPEPRFRGELGDVELADWIDGHAGLGAFAPVETGGKMEHADETLERATELLANGREKDAIETLRALLVATTEPSVADDVRAFAVEAHEVSHGFLKIEWQRLVFDAEARATTPAA